MKKLLSTIPYFIIAILIGVTVAYAGNLTPPGAPAKTMKSLADLYELINTGADTPSIDFATPGAVAATMQSLGDTYDLMTTKVAAIDASTILTGTTIFGVDGSASAGSSAAPLKTGQTLCTDGSSFVPCAGTGQDGESLNGVAHSYTDNIDGTITDNSTGLMWMKCSGKDLLDLTDPDCLGGIYTVGFFDPNPLLVPIDYCEDLSLAGQTDWRLPNINELQTLIDRGRINPAIDTLYFPDTPSSGSAGYFSSTVYEDGANLIWIVFFSDGEVYQDTLGNKAFRCVRG